MLADESSADGDGLFRDKIALHDRIVDIATERPMALATVEFLAISKQRQISLLCLIAAD